MTEHEPDADLTEEELAEFVADRPRPVLRRAPRVWFLRYRPRMPFSALLIFAVIAALLGVGELMAMKDRGEVPPSLADLDETVSNHWPWLSAIVGWRVELALGCASLLAVLGLMRTRRAVRTRRGIRKRPWFLAAMLGLIVAAAAVIALWILIAEANKVPAAKRPEARIEAIKTAAQVAVGTSGVGALFLGARRFWTGEIDKLDDKFHKAVDLLGSDHGQVRVSGMVALEQLAQRNPEFRTGTAQILVFMASPLDPESAERLAAQDILDRRQEVPRKVSRPDPWWG